ncbi:glycoside hydrolase family 18 protein [Rhodotorula paludigena]|uniref:glycoside hydrolase family 18 protein n=1 Tax=Rhodotorula paludigena TaxID=86838 RepID=UPI00318112A7
MRIFSTLGALAALGTSALAASRPLIGNYWPAYNAADQSVKQIPWKYSDLAYYFVTVTTKTGFQVPADQPTSDITAFVKQAKQAGSKPLFSIGGWTGSLYFSSLVDTPAKQTTFAKQIQQFMAQYGFEGVDLDWEYPNGAGIGCNVVNPQDSANLLAFLKVLRKTIGTSKLITAAVSTGGFLGPDGAPLPSFAEFGAYFDYINLMAYDIGGSWSETTGPNAPLRKCKSDTSVQNSVALWTRRGFPASKILLGIPAYAISFTTKSSKLASADINGKWQSVAYQEWTGVVPKGGPGDSNAPSTDVCGTKSAAYSGQWQYKDLISQKLLSSDGSKGASGYTRYFDSCTATPFLFNPSKKHYIGYDDATSASIKARWAIQQGLAGVFVFDTQGFTTDVYEAIRTSMA